jgi:hypothetical protein
MQWGDVKAIDQLNPPFDVVLASDLIYNLSPVADLVRTIEKLAKRTGEVIVGWEFRAHLKFAQDSFLALVAENFEIKEIPHSAMHPKYQFDEFRIVHLMPLPESSVASVLGICGLGMDSKDEDWSDDDKEEDDDNEDNEQDDNEQEVSEVSDSEDNIYLCDDRIQQEKAAPDGGQGKASHKADTN